jgi:membrane protease YdiL (CAAX protease family)
MQINFQQWKTNNIEAKKLSLFFVISFAWTWTFWSLFIFNILQLPAGTGTSSMNLGEMGFILPIILVSPFGPTIAAFVMSYLGEGRDGVNKLWRSFRKSNLTMKWLIITIVLYPLIFLFLRVSSAIFYQISQPTPVWISNPFIILAPFIASILHGGLSEEFGWRGYALPRLQSRYNATQASLILGFFEGLWHVPLVFWVGDARYGMSISLLILWQMIATFYRTWIFNNTDGSVLAAVLFHAMGNTASDIAPINVPSITRLPRFRFVPPYIFFVFLGFMIMIIGFFGYKDMRRSQKQDQIIKLNHILCALANDRNLI